VTRTLSLRGMADRLPFEIVPTTYGEQRREAARYLCSQCEETTRDFLVTGRRSTTPDAHFKKLTQEGWTRRRNRAICPKCSTPPREDRGEEDDPMNIQVPIQLPPPPTMSSELRLQIRSALDKHFDDKAGMYLDGMSDKAIAEHLDIPRAWVENIREAAYGPIRTTPEIVALQADLARVADEVTEMQRRLAAMIEGGA